MGTSPSVPWEPSQLPASSCEGARRAVQRQKTPSPGHWDMSILVSPSFGPGPRNLQVPHGGARQSSWQAALSKVGGWKGSGMSPLAVCLFPIRNAENRTLSSKTFQFWWVSKGVGRFCDLPARECWLILALLQEVHADLGLCFPHKHVKSCRYWPSALCPAEGWSFAAESL